MAVELGKGPILFVQFTALEQAQDPVADRDYSDSLLAAAGLWQSSGDQ